MKFWQKTFIGILILFILFINLCLYLTSQYSFSTNMKRDTDRAMGEYHFLLGSIYESMNSISYREGLTDSALASLMRSYGDYYKKQGVFLELRQSAKLYFSSIPHKDSHILKISGSLGGPYENYTLTYTRDLSELYQSHSQLVRYLIMVSASVEAALALVLFLFLKRLTQPITLLQKATFKIAGGVYDEQIQVAGRDEFHDLAENFNLMAAGIQEKITQLDKNAQEKQRLIDNLAHELRTPLTAIRGYGEYLQAANTSEENRIKAAGYILSEADRMKNLSFKLLDLALIKNSKPHWQAVPILDLFHQVNTALKGRLEEKDIQLKINTELPYLTGDGVLLQSLLINLTDNAIKASPNRSRIRLSAYQDAYPILEVQDEGCGMEADQLELIWEPFYRVDKARARSSGGIGLGMSLCREIADLHGARLRIASESGKGTTVQVVFTTSLQHCENSIMSEDV